MSWRKSTDPDFDAAELHALLRLRMLPAVSDARLTTLLTRYHPLDIVTHRTPALLGDAAFRALPQRSLMQRADGALRMMADQAVAYATIVDDAYPDRFYDLEEYAPPVLFARGDTSLINTRALAVIGARNSTEYGDSVAELFATELARRGITIVSGLARGIDAIAHRAALAVAGNTIAVLGCGIDVYYPPCNARLHERIAAQGLLLSEFAPGQTAFPYNFPKRNRLIALLARAVLVIEAGPRSGTRRTVDWALDHNVDVFAVPGPIGRYESQGTNEIIQQGAFLATGTRDILERLSWNVAAGSTDSAACDDVARDIPAPELRHVFAKLDATALHIDEIARRCGKSTTDTLVLLTQLEIDGFAQQHPGKRFARILASPAHD